MDNAPLPIHREAEPDVVPLLPDGGGFICYGENGKCGYGTTPEEAREAWEAGVLDDVSNVALDRLRTRGYL